MAGLDCTVVNGLHWRGRLVRSSELSAGPRDGGTAEREQEKRGENSEAAGAASAAADRGSQL